MDGSTFTFAEHLFERSSSDHMLADMQMGIVLQADTDEDRNAHVRIGIIGRWPAIMSSRRPALTAATTNWEERLKSLQSGHGQRCHMYNGHMEW
jgi:hypothetical protein